CPAMPLTRRPELGQDAVMPAAGKSACVEARLSGATAAVRSSSTVTSKPSLAASSAVARTQWSVAIPQMSTSSMCWERSQSASDRPFSSAPSKPEYAAEYSPLRKIASNSDSFTGGWKCSPAVPTTQCGGHESTKSGLSLKCEPGSMWWSLVATTVG